METEVHQLRSDRVGDTFSISVGRCSRPDQEPTQVLVLTDAMTCFGATMDMAHIPVVLGELPPLWVVGIGYPVVDFRDGVRRRNRDLTPTRVPDRPGSGGAPAFLGFIREELIPWLGARSGAEIGSASFLGHSLGGLFGAWVLTHEPTAFARYGLSSPSLWWDDGIVLRDAAERAACQAEVEARVLITAGGLETADMMDGARQLAATLAGRSDPGLETECQILEGETHQTACYVSIGRALRSLWPRG
jgi:predicted alpha/beta superfamily hydrolase